MASAMRGISHESVPKPSMMYLVHHVFLPPKVPQKDDHSATHEEVLLKTVIRGLKDFKHVANPEQIEVVEHVTNMITRMLTVRGPASFGGSTTKESLEKVFGDLFEKGTSTGRHSSIHRF
jgi:hypothetical protein